MKKAEPQIVYKGNQTFRHDLFKLRPTELKKNVSFVKGEVKIETYEHSHFFHTIDSEGRPQEYCTAVGGHFHKMTWGPDEKTGQMVAKCGPPLHHVYVRKGKYQRKRTLPVEWNNDNNQNSNQADTVKDEHVHHVDYLWSEEFSADTARRRQEMYNNTIAKDVQDKETAKNLGLQE